MGTIGTQAEYACIPLADGTLVATPEIPPDDLVPSLLAASDVLGTGWFGAVAADAGPGKTVVVGGPAPVRRFLPELIDLIWHRQIDPDKVFDLTLPLEDVAQGYKAMDERRSFKTLLMP
jgi:threonine dehydrogenase-like Zn-dependent dehydrogenase